MRTILKLNNQSIYVFFERFRREKQRNLINLIYKEANGAQKTTVRAFKRIAIRCRFWANLFHADPRNVMSRRPSGKVFSGARIRQKVCVRRDPLCPNVDALLKQMQMQSLCTAVERRYRTPGGVPPLFGDRVVYFDSGELSRTMICESF